jgi:hypothetical protein
MACISKRRGKWVADYRDSTGKRPWETFSTRKEAERALAEHVTAIKDNRYVPSNDKRTVSDAYKSWWKLSVQGTDNRSGTLLRKDGTVPLEQIAEGATRAIARKTSRRGVIGRLGALVAGGCTFPLLQSIGQSEIGVGP